MSTPSNSGATPNSARKRSAREMQEDSERGPSRQQKFDTVPSNEIQFQVECPAGPGSIDARHEDLPYRDVEELAPGFKFECTVSPGDVWRNMKSYRNVKYQDQTFSVGNFIYVNKRDRPPEPLGPDATDDELLEFDRENCWVGRIRDARAEDANNVYIKVNWMYWPEELPMKRQPYHSRYELILSNAMDIIDATTISSLADVTYWNEDDDDQEWRTTNTQFWRQTFDVGKLGKNRKGGLSELRKHCRCRKSHNPDQAMYHCAEASCNTWNHEECLVKEILDDAWDKYKNGTMDEIEKNSDTIEIGGFKQEPKSLSAQILAPVIQAATMISTKLEEGMEAIAEESLPHTTLPSSIPNSPLKKGDRLVETSLPLTPKTKGRPTKSPKRPTAKDILSVTISEVGEDGPVIAEIRELVNLIEQPSQGGKMKREPVSRSWRTRVSCLKCHRFLA